MLKIQWEAIASQSNQKSTNIHNLIFLNLTPVGFKGLNFNYLLEFECITVRSDFVTHFERVLRKFTRSQ